MSEDAAQYAEGLKHREDSADMETAKPDQSSPIINLAGEKVALGPLRHDLLPLYHRWRNDFEVGLYTLEMNVLTAEAMEDWYRQQGDAQQGVSFTIYERPALRPIGIVGIGEINHSHRTAAFGIVVGEKSCWGKGYGTEATRLALDYAFTGLGMHNVWLTVQSFNERAIRAYTRAGFRVIGRWRESRRLGGRVYDTIYMDCLATEFESPVLHRLVPGVK